MQVADYLGSDLTAWSSAFWAAVQAEVTPPITRAHAHEPHSPDMWLRAAPLVATLTPGLAAKLCDAHPVIANHQLSSIDKFEHLPASARPTPVQAALQAALDGAALRTYVGHSTARVCSEGDERDTGWVPKSEPEALSSTLPQPGTCLSLTIQGDNEDPPL